ncbi:MAG: 50S ribosomal protein L35 [bacterium]|nr:50S ribosomal protein L35 [bacterium]
MAKLKTNQAIAKRFKVTKNGKIIKRTAGQGHFNARENGKTGRNKKSDVVVSQTNRKVMATFLQY